MKHEGAALTFSPSLEIMTHFPDQKKLKVNFNQSYIACIVLTLQLFV